MLILIHGIYQSASWDDSEPVQKGTVWAAIHIVLELGLRHFSMISKSVQCFFFFKEISCGAYVEMDYVDFVLMNEVSVPTVHGNESSVCCLEWVD